MQFLDWISSFYLWGNSGYDYIWALGIFILILIVLKIFQAIFLSRLQKLAEKTATDIDDVLIAIFKGIKPPFYFFVALYFAVRSLNFSAWFDKTILVLVLIVVVFEVVRALEKILDYAMRRFMKNSLTDEAEREQREAMIRVLVVIVRIVLWVFGLVLILSNLGINVTSLITGLGIGGIAVALALQAVLGDLFSAFTIYMDKPFQVGDFIVIGNDMGVVKKIGLKSTRITTLQGEQLVISNQEMTKARIQNFKRMQKRRVVIRIGVTYNTNQKKLSAIPEYIKKIVDDTEGAELDRCHFADYGDFSLNFETVFYIDSADYNIYMDIRQKINLEIYEKFAKEKIEFAYPTQTVYLEK